MYEIAKRTAGGALLLLLMPLAIWICGWQWQPGGDEALLKGLFWITETVTSPWGLLTSVILCAWFMWCLRFRLKAAIGLAILLAAALLIGQGVKSLIKDRVQEPRPFVVWLEQNHGVEEKYFYSLPRKARSALVGEQLQDQSLVPGWLRQHWQFETGFAFPSGHTLFAATWALLGVGLLWPRRHYKTVALLMLWATGVMGSRLALGMHWPRDLVMATLIGWLLVTLACWLAQRWFGPLAPPPQEQQEIAQRKPLK
ncbi:phosphatidylglycerophosphatase B [Serratia entomophila]|uniref:phosphatidylglycerophosphatase B n=1 Tax=Serratia entomophila TaxID=42906 RepID=UPI00217862C4|nr:phosphatidylglycerophosphatase B [Serratia entomophila]CAI0886742.1 Phosphatidylglycerophosphatase B [Serratia entomophila]CAI1524652.1 Phosphatidylglycerophosphatase B [Serratia entomophila]CAI1573894.1 Phosphatidylglycerophosphatase B [Serratia entomophila]CAI1580495.1 Phosphatidylglycerophosphatase B [Serratia entomophila]CAI1611311.1 Phosphatidylglycerophosphatase B [Serratia entomophila]